MSSLDFGNYNPDDLFSFTPDNETLEKILQQYEGEGEGEGEESKLTLIPVDSLIEASIRYLQQTVQTIKV
jgi:hypothetical protein